LCKRIINKKKRQSKKIKKRIIPDKIIIPDEKSNNTKEIEI